MNNGDRDETQREWCGHPQVTAPIGWHQCWCGHPTVHEMGVPWERRHLVKR